MKSVKVFDEAFGEKLKGLRKARGMTLHQMSVESGVSQSYISRLERNEKQSPSFPILVELARALKVDVLSLAEGFFKSPLRVADKILTEEETRQIIHLIERIAEFDWNEQTMWRELCEVGSLISAFKEMHAVEPRT